MDIPQMLQAFERDGFVRIEEVLDERQLSAARAGVEWAMAQPAEPYKWIRQRPYEYFHEQPIFVELMEHPLVLEFAQALLGAEFHLIAAQCSRNTRDDHYAPGAMKIHADACFFPDPQRRRENIPNHRYSFSAMWYVQDTPLEMGPTELIPGSHLSEAVIEDDDIDPATLFRQPIRAGSLLLFSHRTWHRGAINHTATPRDLITNAYARPEIDKVQLTVPQEDGSMRYETPDALMPLLSPTMQQLLGEVS